MKVFRGKGVFPGIAFGEVYLLLNRKAAVSDAPAEDAAAEWERYLSAKKRAADELTALYEKTKAEAGEEAAEIVDVQRLMLEDGDFNESVENMIKQSRHNALYAVSQAGKQFSEIFASMDDAYMKARANDVRDVSLRIENVLLGTSSAYKFDRPVIVVADDLTPSETLQLDKSKVRAFVIRQGSASSHTAILARIMNIPCIVQAELTLESSMSGKEMAVDGERGLCWLEPDEQIRSELTAKQKDERERREQLNAMRGLPTVTGGGRKIMLYANIGEAADLPAVLENDSEGIGLFRSEFLYLGRGDYPSEEELFSAYRSAAEGMNGKRVIIRTLDIGADKKADYFKLDDEENPALGLRGIRVCLERPELFKTQLRAIYRAAAYGNIAMMFPMIVSLWEVRLCKKLAEEAREGLVSEGIEVGEVELGVMMETPASVMEADSLAAEVDFFSVGTNDLTQYTLAVDRQNNKLDRFFDPHHPAVLEMLRIIAKAAVDKGIWAGVCGELAADPAMTKTLLDMGYSELSVSPAYTLELRKRIREMD